MESPNKICFVGALLICILYWAARGALAQNFYNSSIVFENITFDMANRGSYNISDCILDLLTCWENVKPDSICWFNQYYSSVCEFTREFCAEFDGDQDASYWVVLMEELCLRYYNWDQYFT